MVVPEGTCRNGNSDKRDGTDDETGDAWNQNSEPDTLNIPSGRSYETSLYGDHKTHTDDTRVNTKTSQRRMKTGGAVIFDTDGKRDATDPTRASSITRRCHPSCDASRGPDKGGGEKLHDGRDS